MTEPTNKDALFFLVATGHLRYLRDLAVSMEVLGWAWARAGPKGRASGSSPGEGAEGTKMSGEQEEQVAKRAATEAKFVFVCFGNPHFLG